MNGIYTFPKKATKTIPYKMEIFFTNGDFIQISGDEISDIYLDYYDTLVLTNGGAARVCHSGYIKFKITTKAATKRPRFLYNEKLYREDAALYLKQRLTSERQIKFIRIFNDCGWSHTILGDSFANEENGIICIKYAPNDIYGDFSSKEYKIALKNPTKSVINKINIDFENCDSFEIYSDEIINMQLEFDTQLEWNSSYYGRKVIGGFMLLKLNNDNNSQRRVNIYPEWSKKKGIRPLIKRLCEGRNCETNICNLYVEYDYAGYGLNFEEKIAIAPVGYSSLEKEFDYECEDSQFYPDYNSDQDFEEYYDPTDFCDDFIGGYVKLCKDKSILITFGKKEIDKRETN